jgi:hypothetical protein
MISTIIHRTGVIFSASIQVTESFKVIFISFFYLYLEIQLFQLKKSKCFVVSHQQTKRTRESERRNVKDIENETC